jgi:hypothetical protein
MWIALLLAQTDNVCPVMPLPTGGIACLIQMQQQQQQQQPTDP